MLGTICQSTCPAGHPAAWGHPPHESSSLGHDTREHPRGAMGRGGRRVGWMCAQTPQQPKTCPSITSMWRQQPALYPAPGTHRLLDVTPLRASGVPSMASTSQPQPGNPAEAKLIYQPKFGQGFRAHLRDSKYWPVDLMLLSHHNPMASGHILSLSPSHSVPVAAPVTWGLQSRPAKLEPGGEGGSIQRKNEPGPSITIQQWG